jgi:outer membrane protein assembly factor BamE (lipoprotein component of BamABCDE complex)
MKVKHFIFCTAVLTGVLLCLSGCRSEAAVNMDRARQLRAGMTKAQVLKIMGEPVKEEFATPDRWYYFVNSVWADGLTTEDECMPLIFEKGRLAGWGSRFYAEWRAKKELKTKDSKQ